MTAPTRTVVDLRPAEAVFHAYAGDPFPAQIRLQSGSPPTPVDCTGWTWAASISTPDGLIAFDVTPNPDGVQLDLDGARTTLLLPLLPCRFDVVGKDTNSVSRTVLAGSIDSAPRVTPALVIR